LVIGCDDLVSVPVQKLAKRCHIEPMMPWGETRQISLRKPEQTFRRRQTPAVLGMQRMFEPFLKMNESPGGLDQSLEEIRVVRFRLEPKVLQNIVRLIVTLLIPATEKRTVIGVCCRFCLARVHIFPGRLGHPL
jgi:hypothetical protein